MRSRLLRTAGIGPALVALLGSVAAPIAQAEPEKTYAPEFTCVVAMSTPGVPSRSCSVEIAAGRWHLDLDAAFVLEGSYILRVEIPDGRYAEAACSITVDPLGPTWIRCHGSFNGLGDEAGGGVSSVEASEYIHVDLPVAGTVTVTGGEGRGIAIGRGARV